MTDTHENMDFDAAWKQFLNSKISCRSCGSGPYNYSTIWSKGRLISKYEHFCSGGCAMTYNPSSQYSKSRCTTPKLSE